MEASTKWTGGNPECAFCRTRVIGFIDGKTRRGYWALMCPQCFLQEGVGVGTGRGQAYLLNMVTGEYEKVMG
jgi:hypothetical protein